MGKEKGSLRIPVHKRIMLLLWDNMSYEDDYEVPEIISQNGIGKELGLRQTHVSRALSELTNEMLVNSRTAHIKGYDRRKKVYFLTKKGAGEIKRLIGEIEMSRIPVRSKDQTLKLLPISKVRKIIGMSEGKPPTMHELLTRYFDGSEVDLSHMKREGHRTMSLPLNPHFFGRKGEVEILSNALKNKRIKMVCVLSIAGQGKTSLLAQFASGLKGTPTAWIGVDEWTRSMGILEEWGLFMDDLGRTRTLEYIRGSKEPVMEKIVSNLIKDLEDLRCVLILDDLHKGQEAQELLAMIRPRIPKDVDVTIITGSRERSHFYGRKDTMKDGTVIEIELQGLDEESAFRLLTERGVPEEEHEMAYKMTRGHPLALELYISNTDIDGYIWEEVTRGLSDEEQAVLKLASIYLQPVPLDALFPGTRADRELLQDLMDKVLLRKYRDGTYSIHDVIREHLRDSMTEEETGDYLEKALSYLSGRGADRDLLHYIGLLSEHDRPELSEVLLRDGDLLVGKGYDHLLDLVPRMDPFTLKGSDMVRYLLLFSDLNIRDGDLSAAEGKLERALEVCDRSLKKVKSDRKKGEVLSLVSRILHRSGEISKIRGIHAEVVVAQKKNVSYNRKYGKKSGLGKALNNLALAYLDAGELNNAMEALKEARNILEESGDPGSKAFVEASIADVYITRRDHNKAKIYLASASSFQPKLPSIRAKLRRRTGECWLKIGEVDEAYSDLTDSYSSFKESGDQKMALWVLLDLYRVDKKMGDQKKAKNRLQRVIKGLNEIKGAGAGSGGLLLQCRRLGYEHVLEGDRKGLKGASRDLADAIMETLEPKRSIIYLDQMTSELKDPELILPLLKNFEDISWSRGDRKGSLVVSLRRASILMGKGDDKGARKLLGSILKKGNRIGFKKAVKKANSLLAQF